MSKMSRTDYTIYKIFRDAKHKFEEEISVHVPFDILMKAVTQFCETEYMVRLDGKATDVWNLFSGTDFIDSLFDDDDFVHLVNELYENSSYIEEDYSDWAELEPWRED